MSATVTINRETPVKPPVTVTITCSEERLQYLYAILFNHERGAKICKGLSNAMERAGIREVEDIGVAANAAHGK